jgi:hypothetical protein
MDLRLTSGWFFLLLGVIVLSCGIVLTDRAPLSDINVNLFAGSIITIFGGTLVCLAKFKP